jgi:hypothetical protein
MASLWLLLSTRMRLHQIVLAATLLATGMMITIKCVLLAPAFLGIAWLRWNEEQRSRDWLLRLAGLGIATGVAFALIYGLHATGLGGGSATAAKGVVAASANKMFGIGDLPYLVYAAKQMLLAPVLATCILLFPGTLLRSKFSRDQRIALAGLFAPLATLFFYHNTAPYYYTFMLPPVVAAISIVIAEFRHKFGTLLVAGLFVFSAFMLWTRESSEPIRNQRLLMAAAEQMFPKNTAYLDFCGFLGSFTKANAFMTPWGIELYKSGFYPSIRQTLATQTVPLVMDNDPMFTRLLATQKPVPEFLPEDAAALRASYIHWWGPYWIAGYDVAPDEGEVAIELLVPGPYTVRQGVLIIDGKPYQPGEVVTLDRGRISISAPQRAAKLVWGDNIDLPSYPAPSEPFWTPF